MSAYTDNIFFGVFAILAFMFTVLGKLVVWALFIVLAPFALIGWLLQRLGMTEGHIDRMMGIEETEQREKS